MLELTVLTVPDCPNEALLRERLSQALTGLPEVRMVHRVVRDEADAARLGLRGSPTLLINGTDPFAAPGTPAGLSCRIYRDEAGQASGAPSVAALRQALRRSDAPPASMALPDPLGRAGRGRLAPVAGGLRAVHRQVLRAFAENGRPPTAAELDEAAAPFGTDGEGVLAVLHGEDFLRLDAEGAIRAAYPFSAVPTAHLLEIENGPRLFSMCAIDALGTAAMVGTTVTIHSAEPGSGIPITVTVPAGDGPAVWEPATAVVFTGRRAECAPCEAPAIAADACCDHINFFATEANARRWARAHPEITGQVLSRTRALRVGVRIFGPLLSTG